MSVKSFYAFQLEQHTKARNSDASEESEAAREWRKSFYAEEKLAKRAFVYLHFCVRFQIEDE